MKSRVAHTVLGLTMLVCSQAAETANPLHPVEDYFREAAFSEARLNPSGQFVLALNRTDADHQYVSLIDLGSETSTDLITSGGAVEHFSGLEWISDDTAVFTDHVGKTDTRLVAVQWLGMKDGKPQTHITTWPQGVYFASPLSTSKNMAMLYTSDSVSRVFYKADVNGSTKQLSLDRYLFELPNGTTRYLLDENGVLKLKASIDDEDKTHYLWCTTQDSCSEFLVTERDELFNPVSMSGDGARFLVFSNIGRDTIGLFEYDPLKKQFTKTLLAKDDSDVTNYYYDWLTRQVTVGVWTHNGVQHYTVLDPRTAGYGPALENAFPGEDVTPIDLSSDGHEMLAYTSSTHDSGTYYAIDLKGGKAELLGQRMPWFKAEELAPTQAMDLETRDGFSISYLLTLPQTGAKPYPLIVIPHGGPIGIFDKDSFDNEAQLFAERGYAVLKVNYRGSGGSGKKFLNAGKKQWGRKIEDDIQEAVMEVLKSNPIDKNRMCIYGGSYGGYSALMSVIRAPDLYKCAASFAGVTDMALLYNSNGVQLNKTLLDDMADIIGDPTTDSVQLQAYSPVYLVDKISRPLLIGQGLQDTRVDPEHAYRLKLMLDTFHKPYEFYTYDEEGHGFYDSKDAVDFYTHLLEFFDKNIGGKR